MDKIKIYESTLESDILEVSALLEENGIVCEVQSPGIGDYLQIYSGVNCMGTGIFVHEKDADMAKELMDTYWGPSAFEGNVEEDLDEVLAMKDYRTNYNKSLQRKRKFILFFLIFMLGSALGVWMMSLLFF